MAKEPENRCQSAAEAAQVLKAVGWLMLGVGGGLLLDLFAKELLHSFLQT